MAPERDARARLASERQDHHRQDADQQDRLHLVFETEHAQSGSGRHRQRPRDAGAASDRDQDHQREDHRARRDELRAQDPRMHGDAAGERECHGREHRHAPVAQDGAGKARENQHANGRDQKRQQTPGANRAGHGGVEGRDVGGRRNRRQLPGVEQAERVQQPVPEFHRKDGEVGWVVEEHLRLAVVEGKRVVDQDQIHVGVAPVDQRVAEQKERCGETGDDRRQSPSPAERSQPVEGVLGRGDR